MFLILTKKVNQLYKKQLIQNVFPIHDQNELKNLEKIWYQKIEAYLPFRNIPISKRNK